MSFTRFVYYHGMRAVSSFDASRSVLGCASGNDGLRVQGVAAGVQTSMVGPVAGETVGGRSMGASAARSRAAASNRWSFGPPVQ